jgi:hypothetical protein
LSHAIGLDKEACWSIILDHLTRNGQWTEGVDIDYSKFDATVPPAFFEYFRRVADYYYHDSTVEERNARAAILHEMQFTMQLIDGHICISQKGNKSGTWLTDMFNSVANHWALMICFHRTCSQQCNVTPSLEDWTEYVVAFTLGDDVIMTIDPRIQQWFNPRAIGEVLHSLGFDPTGADKQPLKAELRPISELTFLKSGFKKVGSVVLPPMPKEISYREMNWIRKSCMDNVTIKHGMMKDALRFMSWHGKTDYDQFVSEIRERLDRDPALSLEPPLIPSWRSWFQDVWTKQAFAVRNEDFCCMTWKDLQSKQ